MSSLIEKINAEIAESAQYGCEAEYRAGLYKAKEIILSEQKEPTYEQLKYYGELQADVIKRLEESNGELSERIVKAEGLMSERVIKPLTIGDKIRESNESLAEFIDKIQMAPQQPVYDTLEYILNYLNQPYTSSKQN